MSSKPEFTLAAVIMAGGKGTRFWPQSRRDLPKQLLCIGTKRPLIVETVQRLKPLIPADKIFISTSEDMASRIKKLLPDIKAGNYILEPASRDTAACVGLSSALIGKRLAEKDKRTVMAVLPADHYIKKPGLFRKALLKAAKLAAEREVFVTIGIKPRGPSTAYGYIQPGAPITGRPGASWVKRFREKPDQAAARRLIQKGCFWNAGMFIFQPRVGMAAFREHLPAMARGLERITACSGARKEKNAIRRLFPGFEKTSFDYGIMEKVRNVALVPGEFGWSDVGGWEALYSLLGGDGKNNVSQGPFIQIGSSGVLSRSGRLVAVVGVSDLVIVESGDAVLVMKKGNEGAMKALVKELERRGLDRFL